MEYYGITFIGIALFFGFFSFICIKRIFEFSTDSKKKHKIWIPFYILLLFCILIRGGSLVYFGITLDNKDKDTEYLRGVLMSIPYMVYLFLYLLLLLHFLIYYINAHINLANDRNIFNNEIPNLTKKTIILLIIVFPIFFVVFSLITILVLTKIIEPWILIEMISIFNIASPGILIAYYVFLNFKFSGRPFRDEHSQKNTKIIIRISILWSVSRIISGIIYLALKITDLKQLIFGKNEKEITPEIKTLNIILIILFFIILEIVPIFFSLDHNLTKTFMKDEFRGEQLINPNNEENGDVLVNDSRTTIKSDQNISKSSRATIKTLKIDIKDYLVEEGDINIGEKQFERKNGLGTIHKGQYKNEDVSIRIIKFDRLSRYNIEDIIGDFKQIIHLDHKNISKFIGYAISQDNRVIIITKESKNCSLYDYIHKEEKKLSMEEKLKIALGIIQGIEYLHENNIVHCHLHSKNILLDEELNPIIVDFGFRNLYELANLFNKYINKNGYSAPEVLGTSGKFFKIPENTNENLEKIDIYSYGMILWEIITNTVPFDVKLSDVKKYVLEDKVRPEVPTNIDKSLSTLIRNCWDSELIKRPSEKEIIDLLRVNPDIFYD